MSMTTTTGSSACFGDTSAPQFIAARAEIIIDRPASKVWSVLTDPSESIAKLWNPEVTSVQYISGESRQENELVIVSKGNKVLTSQSPFYMRTIRIVENQQRVLRIDALDRSFCAFVDHSLYEQNGKTKLVYNGYLELRRTPVDQIKAFDGKKAEETMMIYLNNAFDLLKKIVEGKA